MDRKKQASILRSVRKIHRFLGISLFLLFLVISISGLFLGWKKNSNGYILPKTERGISKDVTEWLPMSSLQAIAQNTLKDAVDAELSTKISRIDARPNKGILKFIFEEHHWSVQLDGATGKVLNVGKRHSDWIEDVHDGSILDEFFGIDSGFFKLTYSSIMGLSLIGFTLTGFWLWYGPKRMKKKN